jgi:hypothetical protein
MKHHLLKYSYPNAQEIYDENLDRLGPMDEKQPENLHRRENTLDEEDEKEQEERLNKGEKEDEVDKLKAIQKRRKDKKEHTHKMFQPHPFYTTEYGNMPGIEGLMNTPLSDYTAHITDIPDAIMNPYNDSYQSASIRIKLRADILRSIKVI